MLIKSDALERLISAIFRAEGCSEAESGSIARHLVSSNLAGHDSHGVIRVPRYVTILRDGLVVRDRKIEVVTENDAMAVLDGGNGFGQSIGEQAVAFGLTKARKSGIAIVALRNSAHIGRIGGWAEIAAEAGYVSVHFVNVAGSMLVAPFGGVDRRMSTAPFCVGVPRPGEPPMILDFATSLVAEGKVLVASNGGKKLPEGALIEPNGALSTDPQTLYGPISGPGPRNYRAGKGSIRAMGEHKGSGLAFMCEILGGALTGGGCAGPEERQRIANGMLSIYMSPAVFGSGDGFAAMTREYLAFFKSSRPASPGGEVLAPGEPELRYRAKRLKEGVPLEDETWQALRKTALAAGISEKWIAEIVG
ncbi:MAG TPA: malate/lactate/ureidoglycolate dehydrogenase [Stellaceae bacterium]|nr:malate/lactate/ureidoglycolate dehydrogenase [Stellaceae bacterium]